MTFTTPVAARREGEAPLSATRARIAGRSLASDSVAILRRRRYFQNCREARRAPSASAASFAQTTSGSTAAWPTQVP